MGTEYCSGTLYRRGRFGDTPIGGFVKCPHCSKMIKLRKAMSGHIGWVQTPRHKTAKSAT